MKKITILFLMALSLMVLGGCAEDTLNQVTEGKAKVEYVAQATNLALESSNATLELYTLYQTPLEYGTENWKDDFYRNKEIIDNAYEEAQNMTVPSGMEQNHEKMLSVMEKTVAVNNQVDTGIQAGENLTESVVSEFGEIVELYKNVTTLFGQ